MPYINEHTAIIRPKNPGHITRRTRGSCGIPVDGVEIPDNISVFWSVNDEKKGSPIEYRFPVKDWTEEAARSWLVKNNVKYDVFTPAVKEPETCYNFVMNADSNKLSIDIHGFVGDPFDENDSRSFRNKLKNAGSPSVIEVDINSRGGIHFDAVSINNALREHPATVITKVSGIAASAATTIFAAGDERLAPSNTTLMIHKPLIPVMISANAEKMRKQADALDKLQIGIVKTLAGVMNKSEPEIDKMLNNETWLTAEDAKENGLVTTVTDEIEINEFHDFSELNYSNIPETVLNVHSVNHGETSIDLDIPEASSGIDKLISYIKNHFSPKNKEPEVMLNQETQDAINAAVEAATSPLKAEVETVKSENASLKTELASSQAAVTQLTTALHNQSEEKKNENYKEFCEKLVNQGRMYPAHVDLHVATLADKFKADEAAFTDENKETPALNAYKKFLADLPVVVPVDERPVARKDGKPSKFMTDKEIDEAINKIMDEKKIDITAATLEFSKLHPDVDITGQD